LASKLEINRRNFIRGAAVLGAIPLIPGGSMAQQQPDQSQQVPEGQVPTKPLGRTGVQVSAMGLGGYLAARTDSEHYQSELLRETREAREIPDEEADRIRTVRDAIIAVEKYVQRRRGG